MLSINDQPLAREAFGRFAVEEVPVTYTLGAKHGAGQRVGEMVITGGGAERPNMVQSERHGQRHPNSPQAPLEMSHRQ